MQVGIIQSVEGLNRTKTAESKFVLSLNWDIQLLSLEISAPAFEPSMVGPLAPLVLGPVSLDWLADGRLRGFSDFIIAESILNNKYLSI